MRIKIVYGGGLTTSIFYLISLYHLFPIFAPLMRTIQAKELKIKFIEILNEVEGFSYEDGNPFMIKIGSKRFYIFLKNLSPAYFKNSPDVTRVQLPYSDHFAKVFKANIPFVILGYDIDNDTIVSWNPKTVVERLNTKSNVSLYSRDSLQRKIKVDEFKAGYLSNGEKIIIFNRKTLPVFFERLPKLFGNGELNFSPHKKEVEVTEADEEFTIDKLYEIKDKHLIAEIKPLLKKHKVLEAVTICTKYYGSRYKSMAFKDWYKIVNSLHQNLNA